MKNSQIRKDAFEILKAGLTAVDPYNLIRQQIRKQNETLIFPEGQKIELRKFDRIYVIGAGKGTAPVAKAMEELLGKFLTGGDIIVKYGHGEPLNKIRLHEAAHPVPDQNTLNSTAQLLEGLRDLTNNDCVFVLLTGGGSALLESLPSNITLDDLQSLSSVLLGCGATIHEINCIRKHISQIKGGQLARTIYPAQCITLALSDVVGDDLSVIASGPTNPDNSTFAQAISILEKYHVKDQIPGTVLSHLEKGLKNQIAETPKATDPVFKKVINMVIGNNRLALKSAESKAKKCGYNTLALTSMVQGEAKEVAQVIAAVIKEIQQSNEPLKKPACLLLGGETTVRLTGKGKGGRNQELALAMAMTGIKQPYVFFSCGTDGTDGPTDAAGAIVDHETIERAEKSKISPAAFLKNNDAYHFFEKLDDLIKTGPTGTNVMDMMVALVK